ncbi:hypothetical protein D0860_05738 [Hortaea werneckii]|uniref:Uncharacterized protein n=1 Tax=Hortaea werneckii TaxID=91943 RepID=A0A3M7GXW1_HORWE|nr:hypothetical protein D0860_05738 [Hortaea werneckii]
MPPKFRRKRPQAPSPSPCPSKRLLEAPDPDISLDHSHDHTETNAADLPSKRPKRGNAADHSASRLTHSDPIQGPSGYGRSYSFLQSFPLHPRDAPPSAAVSGYTTVVQGPTTTTAADLQPQHSLNQNTPPMFADARLLHAAEGEVSMLRRTLEQVFRQQEQRELKIKQDMVLDILKERQMHQSVLDTCKRYQREREALKSECESLRAHHEEHVARLLEENEHEKVRTRLAEGEREAWREEVEHMVDVKRTLEEDLEAIRRLENEERSELKQQQMKAELPPAYGNLNDETLAPPYDQQAKDSGALDIAIAKRTIRDTFNKQVDEAREAMDQLSAHPLRHQTNPVEFYSRTVTLWCTALSDAADHCDGVLAKSGDVEAIHYQAFFDEDHCLASRAAPEQPMHQRPEFQAHCKRHHARGTFVADRLAKLLLDLTSRLLAATEVRPLEMELLPKHRAKISMCFTKVDSTLAECLRRCFHAPDDAQSPADKQATSSDRKTLTRPARLQEMSHYHVQVHMLQAKLAACFNEPQPRAAVPAFGSLNFYNDSEHWLTDQMERARQDAARARDRALRAARRREFRLLHRQLEQQRQQGESTSDRVEGRRPLTTRGLRAARARVVENRRLVANRTSGTAHAQQAGAIAAVEEEEEPEASLEQREMREMSVVSSVPARCSSVESESESESDWRDGISNAEMECLQQHARTYYM